MQFGLGISAAGKTVGYWGANVLNVTGNTTLSTTKLNTVCLTRTFLGTNSWRASVYYNGLLDVTAAIGTNPSAQQGAAIGKWGKDSVQFFNGNMAFVYVWNRALTAQEIFIVSQDPYSIFATSKKYIFYNKVGNTWFSQVVLANENILNVPYGNYHGMNNTISLVDDINVGGINPQQFSFAFNNQQFLDASIISNVVGSLIESNTEQFNNMNHF